MNKRQTMALFGVVILLLLFALAIEGRARFPLVNRVVLAVVRPVNAVTTFFSDRVHHTGDYFGSLTELRANNEKLKKENDALRQDNVALTAMKSENERLKLLLAYKNKQKGLVVCLAKVIGRDIGDLKDTIVIDKGSDAGLKLNMSVVNAAGMVGIVDAVYPHASRILLINSPHSKVGGMDLRGDSRVAGVVIGIAGQDAPLAMKNMPRDADLLPGDTIVTSGYSGHHPSGLIIGTIEEIRMDGGGLTKLATISAGVDFSKLEEVLVITNYDNYSGIVQKDQKKEAAAKKTAEENKKNTQKGGSAQ